jgi:hypothetical protein
MEVHLHEKAGYEGELDLSDTHVRLSPHPQLLDLLVRMQMKTQVAGHWGLMRGHRDWIADGVRHSITRCVGRGKKNIRILQCGIAGLVHYFGNLAILLEQLDRAAVDARGPLAVSLSTRDICAGSTRPVEVLLENLDAVREELAAARISASFSDPFPYIDVDGCVISIDESFWKLASRVDLLDGRIEHDLAVEDLTSDTRSEDSATRYDIVLSHHLLSMWGNEAAKVERLCRNLRASTVPGSELFFAMNTNCNDSSRLALNEYHEVFAEYGFAVAEARLAWDVYDLDDETIDSLLLDHRTLDVMKDCALVHYVRS